MSAPPDPSRSTALQSWKEIATYLGVTVRSAQRWEATAGLPVHRLGSGNKARVFAYPEELLAWRDSNGQGSTPPAPTRWWLWGMALVPAAAAAAFWFLWTPAEPADWSIEHNSLRVRDARGRLLWEKQFPDLNRTFYTHYAHEGDKALIEDIDEDGSKEVLFNLMHDDPAAVGGSLLCYDRRGKLRWEHLYGAPLTIGGRTFSHSYNGRALRCVKLDGRPRLLTVANHYIWHPTRLAVHDPATGRVESEYWHPGWIYHCFVQDLDGDRRPEVLFGAINNPGDGLGHAAVATLKLPLRRGPPVEDPDLRLPGMGGGEHDYLLLPLPDVNRVTGTLPIVVRMGVETTRKIFVQVQTPEGAVIWLLDFGLHVLEVRPADNYRSVHDRLQALKLLDHPLTAAEIEWLGKPLRFAAAPHGNHPKLKKIRVF